VLLGDHGTAVAQAAAAGGVDQLPRLTLGRLPVQHLLKTQVASYAKPKQSLDRKLTLSVS
jgi:hypothetical protein